MFLAHEPLLSRHIECKHEHHEHANVRNMDKKILTISLIMTALMMILQFIYALLTNSLALLSDSLHMFSDTFALFLSLGAILVIERLKNSAESFGYFRLEVLVAFINALSIVVLSLFVIIEAIKKLINPSIIDAKTMIIIASIGLVINAINAFMMFKGANLQNLNIKSAFMHMISDLLGSLIVVIGGVFVLFTNLFFIDSILALIISLMLLRWAINLLKESLKILLEKSPIELNEVRTFILKDERILEILDLHITQITNNMLVATMHLRINIESLNDFESLSKHLAQGLKEHFNIGHITIQPRS